VIDAETASVVATIPTGSHPVGITVHPMAARAHVAHFQNQNYFACTAFCTGYISVIDTVTKTITATFPVGLNIITGRVHPDGIRLYTSDNTNNVLSVIDTATNRFSERSTWRDTGTEHGVQCGGDLVHVANTAGTRSA
jgi:DNA-binding beta-propeller fold protein YncE